MEITLHAAQSLKNLFSKKLTDGGYNLPLTLKMKIAAIYNDITEGINLYEDEFNEILNIYCKRDEKNEPIIEDNTVIIRPEDMDECKQKMKELKARRIYCSDENLTIEDLEPMSDELSIQDCAALLSIVKR